MQEFLYNNFLHVYFFSIHIFYSHIRVTFLVDILSKEKQSPSQYILIYDKHLFLRVQRIYSLLPTLLYALIDFYLSINNISYYKIFNKDQKRYKYLCGRKYSVGCSPSAPPRD